VQVALFTHSPAHETVSQQEKHLQNRHTGESRYPEVTEIIGFRVALRLHGMTKK
jgi:hypothetical protein